MVGIIVVIGGGVHEIGFGARMTRGAHEGIDRRGI